MESPNSTDMATPLPLSALVYRGETRRYAILALVAALFWLVLTVVSLGMILLYLLLFFVLYLFTHSAFISYLKGTAVELSARQFPQLYAQYLHCCQQLQLDTPPRAYVLAADGMLNALATRFLRRQYIVLFSSVVDALADRPEALNFYIGHELGHIRRNHLGKAPFLALSSWIPLLGAAYHRACEYTCDLHGLRCCPNVTAAQQALGVLAAGGEQWRQLNVVEYIRQSDESRGFWMSLHELCGNYPWLTKRMAHLQACSEGQPYRAPARHKLAYLLACFVPRVGNGAGGAVVAVMLIVVLLLALLLPRYQQYLPLGQTGLGHDLGGFSQSMDNDTTTEPMADEGEPARAVTEIAAIVAAAQPMMDQITAYYRANQQWPDSVDVPDSLHDFSLYDEGVLGFLGSDALGSYQQSSVYLYPEVGEDGGITWICHAPDIPDEYLPTLCQG